MGGCIGRIAEEHTSLVNSTTSSDNGESAPRSNGTVRDSIVSQHHGYMGGSRRDQSLPNESSTEGVLNDRRRKKPHTTPHGRGEVPQPQVAGLDFIDSGLSVTSPARTTGSLTRSQSFTSGVSRPSVISSSKGKDLEKAIHDAYKWKDEFSYPSKEFLAEMDKLFMDCQVHLTDLSSRSSNGRVQKEVDALVEELIALRNHWGPRLLPNSVCNAFVRERIYLNLGFQRYRIDCAQFFEPVPFYNQSSQNSGELMKLYRFSVYDLSRNEVIIRYFLERSNVIQLYHVLCYVHGNQRGQVQPYGSECPTYWELRTQMVNDLCNRFHTVSVTS